MPTAFHLLGLAPDADERAIKRAYAARLKTTRPDEDPEGFQRLNEAYQAALAWRQRHPPGNDADAAIAGRMEAAEERPSDPLPVVPVVDDAPAQAPADTQPAPPPTGDDRFRRPPRDMPPSRPAFPAPLAPPAQRDEEREARRLAETRVHPADLVRFHYDCFEQAANASPEGFRAWLLAQPLLLSLQHKAQIGRALLDNFAAERPPVSRRNFAVFCAFFGFDDIGSGADVMALRGLADDMDLLWRAAGGGRPGTRIRLPSDERGWPRFGSERGHALLAEVARQQRMHQASVAWSRYPELRRPWSWPQTLRRSIFLGREQRIAELLDAFDESTWPAGTNRRVALFWREAAARDRFTTARKIVLATRLVVYGGVFGLLAACLWWLPQDDPRVEALGSLLMLIAAGLALVLAMAVLRWQGRPDAGRGALVNAVAYAIVPLLLLAALVLGDLPPYGWSVVPATMALLVAQYRYRMRSGGIGLMALFRRLFPRSWLQVVAMLALMVGAFPFFGFVLGSPWGIPVFSWTCAATALGLWGADLVARRKSPRGEAAR
jgi:hypothetical protein